VKNKILRFIAFLVLAPLFGMAQAQSNVPVPQTCCCNGVPIVANCTVPKPRSTVSKTTVTKPSGAPNQNVDVNFPAIAPMNLDAFVPAANAYAAAAAQGAADGHERLQAVEEPVAEATINRTNAEAALLTAQAAATTEQSHADAKVKLAHSKHEAFDTYFNRPFEAAASAAGYVAGQSLRRPNIESISQVGASTGAISQTGSAVTQTTGAVTQSTGAVTQSQTGASVGPISVAGSTASATANPTVNNTVKANGGAGGGASINNSGDSTVKQSDFGNSSSSSKTGPIDVKTTAILSPVIKTTVDNNNDNQNNNTAISSSDSSSKSGASASVPSPPPPPPMKPMPPQHGGGKCH
jgi:hypothetical protein